MKKLSISAFLLLAMFAFASCTNESVAGQVEQDDVRIESTVETTELENVNLHIRSLSDSIYQDSPVTRGLFSKLRLFFVDVVGGAKQFVKDQNWKAAVAAAAAASIEDALNKLLPDDPGTSNTGSTSSNQNFGSAVSPANSLTLNNTDLLNNSGSAVLQVGETHFVDSLGHYHNATVKKSMTNPYVMKRLLDAQLSDFVDTVATYTETVLGLDKGTITSDTKTMETLMSVAKHFQQSSDTLTVDELMADVASVSPKEAELLVTIKEYLNGIKDNDDEEKKREYSEHVIDIVNKSNLSTENKDALRGYVSIGFASSCLWNVDKMEE